MTRLFRCDCWRGWAPTRGGSRPVRSPQDSGGQGSAAGFVSAARARDEQTSDAREQRQVVARDRGPAALELREPLTRPSRELGLHAERAIDGGGERFGITGGRVQ